ncbi:MAG: hypothetical protein Q7S55_04435 [Nanoarchaeota archaeon]|nr:hypothetical protein [Nanoarchaeota archaeon]
MIQETIKVELPLLNQSRILTTYKFIGELKKAYPTIQFVKYIYRDPTDGALKGVNPPNEIPLVENAYITIAGTYEEVIKFTREATSQ